MFTAYITIEVMHLGRIDCL